MNNELLATLVRQLVRLVAADRLFGLNFKQGGINWK
jgi:hypothetical protein